MHTLQHQLEDKIKELERSNQSLEEFAYAASHDLKEPVRKVRIFTGLLKDQLHTQLNVRQLQTFVKIENATNRMDLLINDLLQYSHVSHHIHEKESVDLKKKLRLILEDLELYILESKAVINMGQLPVVQGYRRQLQQIFQNLVSNALKYKKAGEPSQVNIYADTVTSNGRHYHLIMVEDNGIGFEQQYSDSIFKLFARLHGRQEYSGSGVDLSIVRKVIENHNGKIEAEGFPGKRSTFKVYLSVAG